jgi:hypothetical protein
MPKASDFFPSNYMRAGDLAGKERIVTIDRVETSTFENDGKKQSKPVVHFRYNGIKPLVCNKTNFLLIAAALGDDSDGWTGKRISLYPDMVGFKGTVQEAVRVRRAPSTKAESEAEMNDSVSF